jgi:hypothetical protein
MPEGDTFPTAINNFPIIFNTGAVKRSPKALHEPHLYWHFTKGWVKLFAYINVAKNYIT